MTLRTPRGFTLIEVLVALVVVALGLSALMVTVSGTARTSGYLRDKTLAEWIALNRLTEVRLNLPKTSQNADAAEITFANRQWHYDTRYFDTSIASMKRVVVRVYAGNAKTKGSPMAESMTFVGTVLAPPGNLLDWSADMAPQAPGGPNPTGQPSTLPTNPTMQANPPLPIGNPSSPQ